MKINTSTGRQKTKILCAPNKRGEILGARESIMKTNVYTNWNCYVGGCVYSRNCNAYVHLS